MRVVMTIIGWLGSIGLSELQATVGILSGLVVTGYALTQWWVLYRDKIRNHNRRRRP